MISVIKHTAIVLFAAIVMIASGGFSLVHHYCACSGMEFRAVMVQDVECEHENESHCCNAEKVQSPSCDHCDANLPAEQDHPNHNCCNTEFTFFKTDNFDIQKSVKKSFEFVAAYAMVLHQEVDNEPAGFGSIGFLTEESPPPLYGKDLLQSIQQLKIATPQA